MSETIKGIIKPSELTPFIRPGNFLNALWILAQYSLAFGLIVAAHKLASPLFTLFCMFLMGIIQNTLATFIHEAAHGHVFTNKTLNDKLGHFFFAAPLFSYLEDYRFLHWEHHRHTGKINKDPELMLYRRMGLKTNNFTSREVVMIFIKSLTGIHAIKGLLFLNKFYLSKRKEGLIKKPGLFEHASIAFWFIAIPFLMWKMNMLGTYLLVWIVPSYTFFTTMLLWHGFGEHIREKESCLCENTFSHNFDFFTTQILYPINSSYHLEHHLYPQLPWHSLKRFRHWAETNSEYKRLGSKLEAEAYFFGEKSIANLTFPRSQANESL